MSVPGITRNLVEDILGATKIHIGAVLKHPDGRTVKIVGGQYWGEHGLSNFWYWREVKKGKKLGKLEHGYGWC